MQYFCNLNGRRKESMHWSLHGWFDKIGPWAAEMRGVIIPRIPTQVVNVRHVSPFITIHGLKRF